MGLGISALKARDIMERLASRLEAAHATFNSDYAPNSESDDETGVSLGTPARDGASIYVSALAELISSVPDWAQKDWAIPAISLATALNDLDMGRVTPIVAPIRRTTGSPGHGFMMEQAQGYAAGTLEFLRGLNLSLEDSARRVARALPDSMFYSTKQDRPRWKTVEGWRERVRRNQAPRHMTDAFEFVRSSIANPEAPIDAVAKDVIKRLKHLTQQLDPSLRQIP